MCPFEIHTLWKKTTAQRGGFGPDPARRPARKGRVGLSGSVWPRMLPARPGGASGALLGPSRALLGPKTGPGGPGPPPGAPSRGRLLPPSGFTRRVNSALAASAEGLWQARIRLSLDLIIDAVPVQ